MASLDLTGKTALVTGASRGIGRAIALQLAHHGAAVALASRSRDACETVAQEIRAAGGKRSDRNRDGDVRRLGETGRAGTAREKRSLHLRAPSERSAAPFGHCDTFFALGSLCRKCRGAFWAEM